MGIQIDGHYITLHQVGIRTVEGLSPIYMSITRSFQFHYMESPSRLIVDSFSMKWRERGLFLLCFFNQTWSWGQIGFYSMTAPSAYFFKLSPQGRSLRED
ncbi:hypothetical protein DOZ91_12960 [Peribacillus frigoritolerans]|nr:hypothetical protein DOZ91_12960 [Peribacillus frigoritolerans]